MSGTDRSLLGREDTLLWSLSASRTIHHQVTSTQSGRVMPLPQAASTAAGADPPHQQSSGTNIQVLVSFLAARSLYRTCWRLATNYVIFNQSLDQHLLSTYCILGPEMDALLGTKSTQLRNKEHWAQEKRRQGQDNTQGSLGTHMSGAQKDRWNAEGLLDERALHWTVQDNWGQPVWKEGSRRDANEADEEVCSLLCWHQFCLGCHACMLQTPFLCTLESTG